MPQMIWNGHITFGLVSIPVLGGVQSHRNADDAESDVTVPDHLRHGQSPPARSSTQESCHETRPSNEAKNPRSERKGKEARAYPSGNFYVVGREFPPVPGGDGEGLRISMLLMRPPSTR